jgi:hypothetical protein
MAIEALESQVAEGEPFPFVKLCIAVYAAQLAVSLVFFGSGPAFSVALGGAVALLNLRFLSVFLKALLSGMLSEGYARMTAVVSFYVRITALGAALCFLAAEGMINFPALMVGLSVIPLAVAGLAAVKSFEAVKDVYGRAY